MWDVSISVAGAGGWAGTPGVAGGHLSVLLSMVGDDDDRQLELSVFAHLDLALNVCRVDC